MANIKVNGVEYPVPEDFTLGELADMEEITGQGYDMTRPGVRGMIALAYVAIRRKDPRVTVQDMRDLTMDDIQAVEDEPEPADPPPLPPPDESGGNETPTESSSGNGSDVIPAASRNATGAPV